MSTLSSPTVTPPARRPAPPTHLRVPAGLVKGLLIAATSVVLLIGGVIGFTLIAGNPAHGSNTADTLIAAAGDPALGASIYASTCATCHGNAGQGMPAQGVPLRGSAFVAHATDAGLLEFLRVGRPGAASDSATGRAMPARGGNARLTDEDLADVARYVRTLSPAQTADAR